MSISADFWRCFSLAKPAVASASTVFGVVPTSVVIFALLNTFSAFATASSEIFFTSLFSKTCKYCCAIWSEISFFTRSASNKLASKSY